MLTHVSEITILSSLPQVEDLWTEHFQNALLVYACSLLNEHIAHPDIGPFTFELPFFRNNMYLHPISKQSVAEVKKKKTKTETNIVF